MTQTTGLSATAESTARLCSGLLAARRSGLPEHVRREAVRSLLNVAATAVAGSRTPTVDTLLAAARQLGHVGAIPVPGRRERCSQSWAVVTTGAAAHVDDFDDTHLATVIHPAAATLAALWPLMVDGTLTSRRMIEAFALGIECQLRVGLAMTPWHYDEGWHITGTCGVLGAAVAVGIALDFDAEQLAQALGIAGSGTVGVREGFGTTTKSWHVGKAAVNGWLAAQLARRGFTGSPSVLEAPRGYLRVLSPGGSAPERLVAGLGERWELLDNTYKPYPCGIVSHPAIEAAVLLAARIRVADVASVELICHPLVVELTGSLEPTDGLQARFSTAHGVAAGLLTGSVGLAQYEDDFVVRSDVTELRRRILLRPDEGMPRNAASLTVTLSDGSAMHESIDKARGSTDRPLPDDELDRKVCDLVDLVLPDHGPAVCTAVRGLDGGATRPRDVVDALLPEGTPR